MSYGNTHHRTEDASLKREISPLVLFGILSVLALVLLGTAGFLFLKPAPEIPNPATVQEPTG